MNDDIIEALESSAPNSKNSGRMGDPSFADERDIKRWCDSVMRFINELDEGITVGEIRMTLEEYR